jgi:hypothetical protein
LAPDDRKAVEDHLALCPACLQFGQRLGVIDAALAAAYTECSLFPAFKARLLQRIALEAAGPSAEAIAARRQQVESEFAALMACLRSSVWRAHVPMVLRAIGWGSAVGIALLVLRSRLAGPSLLETAADLATKAISSDMAWVWSVIAIAAGLAIGFGRWLRGLLSAWV